MLTVTAVQKRKLRRTIKLVGFNLAFVWSGTQVFWSNQNFKEQVSVNQDQIVQIRELQSSHEALNKTIGNLVTAQSSRNGSLDKLPVACWAKILKEESFIILFVNKSYTELLPNGINRLDLFGRTGAFMSDEFSKVWQKNDMRAAYSKDPIIVVEPCYYKGREAKARFMKWRDWDNDDDVVVYGMLIEIINNNR